MPIFEIQGANGEIYELDAPDQQSAINAYKKYAVMTDAEKAAGQVSGPQSDGHWMDPIKQGASFGFSDEIEGGIDAAGAFFQGKDAGQAYHDRVAQERADIDGFRENHPVLSPVLEVAGAIPTLLVGGGIGTAAKGATTAAKAGQGAIGAIKSGAIAGGLYGAGTDEGNPLERLDGLRDGALIGAATGGAMHGVSKLIPQKVKDGVANQISKVLPHKVKPELSGNRSTDKLFREALNDDGILPHEIPERMAALGDDAFIADLGPNLTRQAGAVAAAPGKGQKIVRNAYEARHAAKNQRIKGDVNKILGPSPLPSKIDDALNTAKTMLSPEYQRVLAKGKPVDTKSLADRLDGLGHSLRGDAQRAALKIREMLNKPRTDILDDNPSTLLEVRHAIDGMFEGNVDGNVRRVLTEARKAVDDKLAEAAPGIKKVDAFYQELARQQVSLKTGKKALDAGKEALTPEDFDRLVFQGVLPEGQMHGPSASTFRLTQGNRAEIERLIGTKANDLTTLKSALKGDGSWNRAKLETLYGKDKADDLLTVLEREIKFEDGYNVATRNSETQARKAMQDKINPKQRDAQPFVNVTGAAWAAAKKGLSANDTRLAMKSNEELAKLLMANEITLTKYQQLLDLKKILPMVGAEQGASTYNQLAN